MQRRPVLVTAALLLVLSCRAEPYPSVGGTWEYASSLTFPSDFDVAPGQAYVCTYQASLSLDQASATFSGTYDSLTTACNSGGGSSGNTGTVLDGALSTSGILSFDLDSPNWVSVGTLHGDSMGGIVTDSVIGLGGTELASGTWSACKNRVCR